MLWPRDRGARAAAGRGGRRGDRGGGRFARRRQRDAGARARRPGAAARSSGRRARRHRLRRRRGHRRGRLAPPRHPPRAQAQAQEGRARRDRLEQLVPGRRPPAQARLTASPWRDAPVDLRVEVSPPWPFRIGRGSGDGILRRRGATLMRLLHVDDEPVLAAVAQTAPRRVLFAARSACERAAAKAIERMRFATGVDDDLRPFYERFADDPVIGVAVRTYPHIRIHRRPDPWEALAWAITEQLIELDRAFVIQRRLVARLGRRCPHSGLRDMPTPSRVAAMAPAELEGCDLAHRRALALRHAAREVAAGRVDLADRAGAWRRLR